LPRPQHEVFDQSSDRSAVLWGSGGKTAGWHRACLIQSSRSISVTDNCLYRGAASSFDPNHPSRPSYHTRTHVCVVMDRIW